MIERVPEQKPVTAHLPRAFDLGARNVLGSLSRSLERVSDYIEESYISVAGAWSENEQAVYAPGSLILNKPGQEHRITTGQFDPCLLAWAWIGPGERLAEPGMKFSKSRKRVEHGI